MDKAELTKTIDWLNEYVNRMRDREDCEEIKDNIDALARTVRELEERAGAL